MSKRVNPRPVSWPIAVEVATAIVAAARLEGEDPMAVAGGKLRSRARLYAFAALAVEFPSVKFVDLMRLCGAPLGMASSMSISARQIIRGDRTKNSFWFDLDRLNAVRAACGWALVTQVQAEMRKAVPRSPFTERQAFTGVAAE